MREPELLVIIPARGGSRGVRRKNVHLVGGEPLVARAVRQAQTVADEADMPARVVVATNDPQIAQCARLAGAEVVDRTDASEAPDAPVMAVVNEVYQRHGKGERVLVWQPSTVLRDADLGDLATGLRRAGSATTFVAPDPGIRWQGDMMLGERVNRQQAAPIHGEVGIFYLPDMADVAELSPWAVSQAVDIDEPGDLMAARLLAAEPPRVVFAPACGGETLTGTGHLHRALLLADELPDYDVSFMTVGLDDWGIEVVEAYGYPTTTAVAGALVCLDGPDLTADLVETMRYHGARAVAVFEDDGPAAAAADIAVNELLAGPGLAGPRYATIRPEFHAARTARPSKVPHWDRPQVLVTFGGSDPMEMSDRVTEAVLAMAGPDHDVHQIMPPMAKGSPWEAPMAEEMAKADLVVTSAGRTVYEAMHVGVPVVSIPVNEREAARPASRNVCRTPPPWLLTDDQLRAACAHMLGPDGQRMARAAMAEVDGRGAERVAYALRGLVGDLL